MSLPDPLVPADVDLRDFAFMPLDVQGLLSSQTWIEAADHPRLGHALMCLWAASWHQVPAGSLPENDRVLSRLAMCSLKTWIRLKPRALASWVRCSDGRYYHPIVAEKALEGWSRKRTNKTRGRAGAQARWGKPEGGNDASSNASSMREAMLGDSKGQGQGQGEVKPSGLFTRGSTATSNATRADPKPDGKSSPPHPTGTGERWWDSNEGIEAKGRELNVPANPGELHGDYKRRLFDVINGRRMALAGR